MNVKEIYTQIAQKVIDSIDTDSWKESTVEIKRIEKTVSFKGDYIDNSGKTRDINVSFGYYDSKAIHELHKITTEGGNNRWNRAIFKLYPDGKFDMEFIWDQELHDEIDSLNKE